MEFLHGWIFQFSEKISLFNEKTMIKEVSNLCISPYTMNRIPTIKFTRLCVIRGFYVNLHPQKKGHCAGLLYILYCHFFLSRCGQPTSGQERLHTSTCKDSHTVSPLSPTPIPPVLPTVLRLKCYGATAVCPSFHGMPRSTWATTSARTST